MSGIEKYESDEWCRAFEDLQKSLGAFQSRHDREKFGFDDLITMLGHYCAAGLWFNQNARLSRDQQKALTKTFAATFGDAMVEAFVTLDKGKIGKVTLQ